MPFLWERTQKKMAELKIFLRAKIKQKLNPFFVTRQGFQKKVYLKERCNIEEFLTLFPSARKYGSDNDTNKFSKTRKLYQINFENMRELDSILGPDWDVAHNGRSVGCALPKIAFRLVETTINSHQSDLSDELPQVHSSELLSFTSVSITIHRSGLSRCGIYLEKEKKYKEADWKAKMSLMQKQNLKLIANRKKMAKKEFK